MKNIAFSNHLLEMRFGYMNAIAMLNAAEFFAVEAMVSTEVPALRGTLARFLIKTQVVQIRF